MSSKKDYVGGPIDQATTTDLEQTLLHAAHLNLQESSDHERNLYYDADDLSWDGSVMVDGTFSLLSVVRAVVTAQASPVFSEPDECSSVLIQVGEDSVNKRSITLGFFNWATQTWHDSVTGETIERPECWWRLPAMLSPKQLSELGRLREPDPEPDPVAEAPLEEHLGGECPKCGNISGDDWSQCRGECPIPGSPHYTVRQALRSTLRAARKT